MAKQSTRKSAPTAKRSMRLWSYLQRKHSVSRRDVIDMLSSDVVYINEELVTDRHRLIVDWDQLRITIPWQSEPFTEDVQIRFMPPKLVLFHKPKWVVVSKDDPYNKTIYSLLPDSWKKDFWYIWRLDKESSWLMILTNQSRLVDRYENPHHNVYKVYEVEIDKRRHSRDAKRWVRGAWITEDGKLQENDDQFAEHLKAVSITYKYVNDKHYLIITLNEWKKRHIRRLLKWLWYWVRELKRVKVGKRSIGSLKPWAYTIQKKLR